ncbi:MAG: hypothetical protein ACE5G1_01670 [bacterium]
MKKTLSRMGYGSILTDDGSRDSTTSFQTKAYLFVEYGISKIDVRYEKASKDSVSFMQKVAEVGFFLKVREGDLGPVIYDRFFEGRREVRPESGRFSLGTGQAKKVKNGGRILAPVLISTVTGVIVYLFYALRSR